MANAYKCDRCGRYFEKFSFSENGCRVRLFESEYDRVVCSYHHIDLCPECAKDLTYWFEYPSSNWVGSKENRNSIFGRKGR